MTKRAKYVLKSVLALMLVFAMLAGDLVGIKVVKTKSGAVVAEAASNVLSNDERGVIYADSRTDFRDETIYFLLVTRFYDGDTSNNARTSGDDSAGNPASDPSWRGDFKGLIDKLDYIQALGFTAIWITPIVENKSDYDYHGYHAYDFSAVDTRYESNGVTYQDLIDAVHAKGMKLIQDVVFNHTSQYGERNLCQLDANQTFTQRNQIVMNGKGDVNSIYHHNGFTGGGDWDNYLCQNSTMADDCFDLETENPIVYNYLINCYTNYINMGVDAFRVDTTKHISRLTFNSTFIPRLHAAAKAAGNDKFYMFGEVCTKGESVWYRNHPPISTCFYTWADTTAWTSQWSNDLASNEALVEAHYTAWDDTSKQPTSNNAFLNGNTYHTPDYSQASGLNVIDFQMHWNFINANGAFNTALRDDKYFNDSTWNVVYVNSHDFSPNECQKIVYNGGTDAWAENLDLMFTFRGIPCVYYGTEIEFQKGCQIDVGSTAKISTTGRAYYGDNIEGDVTSVDFTVFGNVDGKVGETLNSTLSQHIMRLNRLRQAIPALRKGQYSTEGCSGNMAFKRRYTDSSTDSFVLVAISGDATFTGIPNGTYVDAITGDTKTVTNGTLKASVSGKGNMKVYVLNTALTKAPGRVITNGDYLTDGGAKELIGPVEVHVVNPTSITLDKTSVSVKEETTATVKATVLPADAKKTVTWTSSNPSVATVSGGTITGVSVGTATITAKTVNGIEAKVKVTVVTNPNIVKPTGITLDKTTTEITAGKTDTVVATVLPSNATNKTVTWESSDSSVATVSDGTIKAIAEGTATITASTVNGYKKTVKVTVTPRYTNSTKLYFKNTENWSTVNAYAWSGAKAANATWPGEKMTCVNSSEGIYVIELDKDANYQNIIFNNGSAKTDDLTIPGYEYMYTFSTGEWEEYSEDSTKPTITASIESGKLTEATNVTFTVKDATSATYSLNGATAKSFTDKITLTVGNNETDTVAIVAKNANGTASKTYTYTLSQDTTKYVYFKNTSNWSSVYAYAWNEGSGKNAAWPGEKMTCVDSGNGVWRYELKSDYANIIFNDGTGGTGKQTADLTNKGAGYMYVYSTGSWENYEPVVENGTVYVKYVDENGNELSSTKLVGKIGTSYSTSAKTITGYTLKTKPSNATGVYTKADITVKYIYTKAANTGWKQVGTAWYYYDANGKAVTGWKQISGKWYYFNTSGVMQTGWKQISGKWYYLGTNGAMQTGWTKVNNKWYYLGTSGVMQTGWTKISDKWYYLGTDGAMQTGWTKVSDKWYYLDDTGVMQVGWTKVNNKWYYLGTGGVMQIGWLKISGKWYYLDKYGVMQTGWQKIGNYWYYFNASGVMQTSKYVDNCYLDANGRWVK